MRVSWSHTDTATELRLQAECSRDTIILDLFTNSRQGGPATVTTNADGDLVIVSTAPKK